MKKTLKDLTWKRVLLGVGSGLLMGTVYLVGGLMVGAAMFRLMFYV